jgi:TRAP-type C4-dicarboxylate transport system substrate-binding protein
MPVKGWLVTGNWGSSPPGAYDIMNALVRFAFLSIWIVSFASTVIAEPIKLKFAYFSSDRTTTYLAAIKPFVDAVNAEAENRMEIEVGFSGVLGKNPALQLQMVLDGTADIAFVVPGYTPERFPDNVVVELPGLFHGIREATLVYSRLVARGALQGYDEIVVVGAFATEPESIHSRSGIARLEDLKGKRIRANNLAQAAALERLGAIPFQMPINQASSAISSNKLDGATVSPAPLIEFGISRVAAHHYLLGVGAAPLAVVMSRKKFDSLPEWARGIIHKFSGEWTAERFIATYGAENKSAIEHLRSDPERDIVMPSEADRERAKAAFGAVIENWLAHNPRNRELFTAAEDEILRIRSGS